MASQHVFFPRLIQYEHVINVIECKREMEKKIIKPVNSKKTKFEYQNRKNRKRKPTDPLKEN